MLEAFITWKIKSEQRSVLDFLSPLLKVSFIYYAVAQSVNSGDTSWSWGRLELQRLPVISVGAPAPRGHPPQTAGVHCGKKDARKLLGLFVFFFFTCKGVSSPWALEMLSDIQNSPFLQQNVRLQLGPSTSSNKSKVPPDTEAIFSPFILNMARILWSPRVRGDPGVRASAMSFPGQHLHLNFPSLKATRVEHLSG